eukprot:1138112-Pelagomonas_calceolata.AAC.1
MGMRVTNSTLCLGDKSWEKFHPVQAVQGVIRVGRDFTLYRLYANILGEVVTGWCKDKNKIPDTQF